MNYRVIGLDESSPENDMKKAYRKLALQSHPDKNRHSQASDVMHMINDAKERLGDLLRHNDAMREKEEDIQHQEEAWREVKQISKSKE